MPHFYFWSSQSLSIALETLNLRTWKTGTFEKGLAVNVLNLKIHSGPERQGPYLQGCQGSYTDMRENFFPMSVGGSEEEKKFGIL